jgi:hypothetical protein
MLSSIARREGLARRHHRSQAAPASRSHHHHHHTHPVLVGHDS